MRDVAALAGVSLKTVSRVVNQERGVSEPLAARVHDAVRLLSYRHNLTASSLRRADGKSSTIGLVMEDVSNPFSSSLHRAVENVARGHDTLVFAASSDNDPLRERELLRAFASRNIDGLIAVPAGQDQSGLLAELRQGTPVVFVDRPDEACLADSITVDNRAGAERGVRHLQNSGHRRIGYLGDRRTVWTATQRFAGYRDAMRATGVDIDPDLVQYDVISIAAAHDVTARMLALPQPPTAFFTAQNLITVGAIRALREAGRQHDVAIVGFDDFVVADLLDPGITVVAQGVNDIGTQAAELLFRRIAGLSDPVRQIVTEPHLIVRGSGEIRAPRTS